MRETRSPMNRMKKAAIVAAAVPMVASLVPVLSTSAAAQSSLPLSSNRGGLSDNIRPSDPPKRTPIEVDKNPQIPGLPEGVSVDRIEWLTNRRVAVFIRSAAMPEQLMQVQILLARDWHSNPQAKFPEVWALDGLRARDDENGWTIETNIEQFYADKNVNVILPVGGESSFYSDWQRPNNGKNYKWETFLTKELVPVLNNEFRSNDSRAVVGISMGGTAAINLAERNPHLFKFVGSFSGYLDTTTTGMPTAIKAAQMDAGGYDSEAMWGPAGSQDWIDHDPKLGIEALKDMTVYVSSGSGRDDFGNPESVAKSAANPAGVGLEVISRLSTQTFVDYASRTPVKPVVKFRPSGVHSWEYWQFEMTQAWPYIANALALAEADRGSDCNPVGAIAEATKSGVIGSCVNNEYDVADGKGKAEDFRGGTAFWSPKTGAYPLFGAILAKYSGLGGASSWLGFPTTGETKTPDGVGRFVHFENGSIYWTPQTGAYAIPGDMFKAWGENGYETGDLKYPVAEANQVGKGYVQKFQGGFLTRNPDKSHNIVHGAIAEKYGELGTATSALGYPKSNEIAIRGGFFQQFEKGNIYWSPETGAHVVLYGDIFEEWGKRGYEQGAMGWPTSDMREIPAGGLVIDFQHGTLEQVNGVVRERK
ncbi:alpha/beta hydrolase-fold protein [Corynebacterium pseudogenitalium]|uniref:alpha/beta hydrolase-fold protein n=1 Tax=Corynebacterium pseudogenitalium TaxID=38303 RepID=UPI002108BC2B|nr:alpha/beta hydrolase-fold protein [Corynebacterium pseudogenitalium]UUA87087.1 alpha/beta hydrolase-fold protein [Corynebacterium pseudogenitalium]